MFNWLTKRFQGQEAVKMTEGNGVAVVKSLKTATEAYNNDGIVKHGVDSIVNASALVKMDVKPSKVSRGFPNSGKLSVKQVSMLLNDKPNPDMSRNGFMRLLYQDLVFFGFAFVYHDKNSGWLWPLKADLMEVVPGTVRYVDTFRYNNSIDYKPEDIMFIKDNGFRFTNNQLMGTPRVNCILDAVNSKREMRGYQDYVFKSKTLIQFAVETEAVLNKKMKARFQEEVQINYNTRSGRSSTLVLDAGMKLKEIRSNIKDVLIPELEQKENQVILEGLGVIPPLTKPENMSIDSIMSWFYNETVTQLARMFSSEFERHFGMDIDLDWTQVPAMQADIKKQADATATKLNNGIITPNEARSELRYDKVTADQVEGDFDPDKIRTPANIAGSAANPSLGGRPENEEE